VLPSTCWAVEFDPWFLWLAAKLHGRLGVELVERGLDSSGPVRVLRRRLAEYLKSNPMEGADGQPSMQASVPADLPGN
jgi:hypothetical protein